MPRLSLKTYLLLPTVVALTLGVALLGVIVWQMQALRLQNETVHTWGRAIAHAEGGLAAARELEAIAHDMRRHPRDDELPFRYLEQLERFSEHASAATLLDNLPRADAAALAQTEATLNARERPDAALALAQLTPLIPRLESAQQSLWVQKRAAYMAYYENVNDLTRRITAITLAVLALSIVSTALLATWALKRVRARIHRLLAPTPAMTPPLAARDELDALAQRLTELRLHSINAVANEQLLRGTDTERRRIAMDLHDQTLSDLTHIQRALHALKTPTPALNENIEAIVAAVADTAHNIREIMDDLYPQALDTLGLEAALRSHIDKQLRSGTAPRCHLHVDAELDTLLSADARLQLYRIVLEALSNCLRHAHCSRCEIDCRIAQATLHLTIEDNGLGFDRARAIHGRGLTHIEQRAQRIGAQLDWSHSRFSSGARLTLQLPLILAEPLNVRTA